MKSIIKCLVAVNPVKWNCCLMFKKKKIIEFGSHIIALTLKTFFSPRAKDENPESVEGERFSVLQNKSLQIIGAEKDDSGEYLCVASNTEGRSAVTAVLNVKGISTT